LSAVAAIRYLLAHYAPLSPTIVSAVNIVQGDVIPEGGAAPGIVVRIISSMPRNFIRNTGSQVHRDRIQVSGLSRDYAQLDQMMTLILAACPSSRGSIGGVSVIDIIPDIEGPELYEEATKLRSRSRDFLVHRT
jgi:hypothetical protein